MSAQTEDSRRAAIINPLFVPGRETLEDTAYHVSRVLICLTHLSSGDDGPRDGFDRGLDLILSCCIAALGRATGENDDLRDSRGVSP